MGVIAFSCSERSVGQPNTRGHVLEIGAVAQLENPSRYRVTSGSMRTSTTPNRAMCTGRASDVGWAVGHSYIVDGPLMLGATSVLYEGRPVGTPDAGAYWRVAAEHKVKALFTAPTAIRVIKKQDPGGTHLGKHDRCGEPVGGGLRVKPQGGVAKGKPHRGEAPVEWIGSAASAGTGRDNSSYPST
jgi:hypothetical protein